MKGGTLCSKFALAPLPDALGGFRIVSKKWTDQCEVCSLKKTRRERLKSALYLRLKKRIFFSKKNLKFSKKKFLRKMSHSALKNQKGDPLASDGFVDYVKKVQNERGDPLETKKFEKKSHSAEKNKKNRKGGLCSPVRFCRLP